MAEFFGGMMLLLIVFSVLAKKTLEVHNPSGSVTTSAAKGIFSWLFRKLK